MNISHIRNASNFRQTALVIDDQSTVLDIHVAILKSLNMNLNIVTMTDPLDALAWLINKQVDLIITDFRMHNMDGMQFVQTLKNSDNVLAQSIVVVTVLNDTHTYQELISAGASACLTKPVKTDELAEIAKNLLEQSKKYYELGLIN